MKNLNERNTPDCTALTAALSDVLGEKIQILSLTPLPQSTRAAPWRVDVQAKGQVRSFVLRQTEPDSLEFAVLQVLASHVLPTPTAWINDVDGTLFGYPAIVTDFVAGESLLPAIRAGAEWAVDRYLDSVCLLQSISPDELGPLAERLPTVTAHSELLQARAYFDEHPDPLADKAYAYLLQQAPTEPEPLFSNGDLYPDNLLFQNGVLQGVIDFESVAFSNPIYEFLNLFFVCPDLRGRGIEEAYCARMRFDPADLAWYRAMENFVSWSMLASSGKAFLHLTSDTLRADVQRWLNAQ